MCDHFFGFFTFSRTSSYFMIALNFKLECCLAVPNVIVGTDEFWDIMTVLQMIFYAGFSISSKRTDQVNHNENNVVSCFGFSFGLSVILILKTIFLIILRTCLFSFWFFTFLKPFCIGIQVDLHFLWIISRTVHIPQSPCDKNMDDGNSEQNQIKSTFYSDGGIWLIGTESFKLMFSELSWIWWLIGCIVWHWKINKDD